VGFPITVHEARKIPFLVPAALDPKAAPDREAERNARIIKCRGNWGGGQRGGEVEPEAQGNETNPDKEREEDKFIPMGGGDGDDKEVEEVTFQVFIN
jgi:hypothetical protein